MAVPTHRVQLLKQESTAGGGDDADSNEFFPAQLDPTEDAPEALGYFLGSSGNFYITFTGNDMIFKDVTTGVEVTLSQLLGAAPTVETEWSNLFLMMGG